MSRNVRRCLFLVVLLMLPLIERTSSAQFTLPPNPGNGAGGTCSYCDQKNCGCADSSICTLNFSCGCSSIWCSRSCDYTNCH